MKKNERTTQRLDPLGTLATWLLPVFAAVIVLVYSCVSLVWHRAQVSHPFLLVFSMLILVGACAVLVIGALPSRAPFTRTWFIVVVSLVLIAAVSFFFSVWGDNGLVQDDWGQVTLGLIILSMAQLRPPIELEIAGLISALVLGGLAATAAGFLEIEANPLIYSLVVAVPIIAMAFGAAAYSRKMVHSITIWQERAGGGMAQLKPQVQQEVIRSVQREYIAELNREANPLLERIVANGSITQEDQVAAHEAAQHLRDRMSSTLLRSWIEDTLERIDHLIATADRVGFDLETDQYPSRQVSWASVSSKRELIDAVSTQQRAVLGAFIARITHHDGYVFNAVTIATRESTPGMGDTKNERSREVFGTLELVATGVMSESPRAIDRSLKAYLSVLRVISVDAKLRVAVGRIEMSFSYELR